MATKSIFSYHEWHPCQLLFSFRGKGWDRRQSTTRYDFSRIDKMVRLMQKRKKIVDRLKFWK